MAMRGTWIALWIGALSACAGSAESSTKAEADTKAAATAGDESTSAEGTAVTAAETAPQSDANAAKRGDAGVTASAAASSTPPVDPNQPVPLPPQVDGGEISRPELLAVLERGVGRFLQRVRVSAERDAQGRFAGWHIVQLFAGESVSPVVQAGDTLLRINGQSVERPEQLKTVWDSLVNSSELVLTVRRAGQQSEIRYRIVEPASASPAAPTAPAQKRS